MSGCDIVHIRHHILELSGWNWVLVLDKLQEGRSWVHLIFHKQACECCPPGVRQKAAVRVIYFCVTRITLVMLRRERVSTTINIWRLQN